MVLGIFKWQAGILRAQNLLNKIIEIWRLIPRQSARLISSRRRGKVTSKCELDSRIYFSRNVLVHTHIAKTGGSSLVEGLSSILGKEHVCDLRGTNLWPQKLTPEQLFRIWVLSGHFWFDTRERPIARRKKYIMCVRDPVERFLSHYNYVAVSAGHPDHQKYGKLNIEEAFEYLKKNAPKLISNPVCSMFGDRMPSRNPREPGKPFHLRQPVPFEQALEKIEKNYALVIPMNRVDDALGRFVEIFGHPTKPILRENIGIKKVGEVPRTICEELKELNQDDYKLIAHFEVLFDTHLEALSIRLTS